MDKKRIALVGVIALLVIASIIVLVKTSSQAIIKVNPAFRDYVSAFTSGIISTESTIKVELAHDYADSAMFDQTVTTNLFDFSPDIKGKAYWINTRTVEFRPAEKLPPGRRYTAKFYISKILNMPDSLRTFRFQFTTTKQAMEVNIENHKAYDKKNLAWEKLSGIIRTADAANIDNIKKTLEAKQGDRDLKITVTAESSRKSFRFVVDSISRGEQASTVTIEYDGSAIKASGKGSRSVGIPSINDFVFTGVQVFQTPEQYVLMQFSDPIMEDQELKGIIRISDGYGETFTIVDNEIRLYLPDERTGDHFLVIEKSLKNTMGKELKSKVEVTLSFENLKPDIRMVGEGVILPSSNGLAFPFEAVNLKAVDVKIMRIYENNIAQFLQVNNLQGQRELSRVGKVILKKTVRLSSLNNSVINYSRWNRFSLDLAELIKAEPGAIYRITLSFKKTYSLYPCSDSEGNQQDENLIASWDEADEEENWDYYNEWDDYYYYDDYEYGYYYDWYGDNEDPCENSYYNYKSYSRNILASDVGLTAKFGTGGNLYIYAANLVTAEPMSGVSLEMLDYQNQVIVRAVTDGDGMAQVQLRKTPHLLVATKDRQKTYLRLAGGSALSLSMFDVSGESVRRGLKGFIYGERGVWRPGDSIYLSFILEDKLKKLPPEVPVIFNLINPRGQKIQHMVKTKSINGFYDFRTATDAAAPTGNYTAHIKVGGAQFSKTLKIETIKPNRLKIKLDFSGTRIVRGQQKKGLLEARWLHGAIARNLKARVTVNLSQTTTAFDKYSTFIFDDPSRRFYTDENVIFDARLDAEGKAEISPNIDVGSNAPGILRAYFETRVFEEGGDFSVDRFSLPYYPYISYVGVHVPEGDKYKYMLETGKDHPVSFVNLDADGRLLSNRKIRVDVYKVNWRWWWDNSGSDLASFVRSSYNQPVDTRNLVTTGGKATFNFKVDDADWGRYFIRATDVESGHSCGEVVYVDWSNWASRSRDGKEAASMLVFSADKDKYEVGDQVKLTIPSSEGGKALVTLESGSRVLQSFWVDTEKEQTIVTFDVTDEMAPNIYACVSLIQPHAQTANDLPIRLYGVIPILIDDPNTHLKPVINMPDVLVPEANASITVKEESGKPMTYTLAVVDEGLLDLTKFKTPDPWSYFYAREALGIKTWDIYDDVIGAYGGELERLLSIGGGDEGGEGAAKNRANRFKPMVKFYGPFALKKGGSNTYNFKMPQYIGSVRVMVIAGQDGAYGSAEKTVAVKKPLMVLATLPRVVGPEETIKLPVAVFAMEKNIKTVTVKIQPNNMFTLDDDAVKTVQFREPGDELVTFSLKVKAATGIGKVKVLANCGNEYAYHEIEIDVRNPNPPVTEVMERIIKPGESWSADYTPVGVSGTNAGTIEVSSIPPINLEKRLKYLLGYPYGCIEQTVSSVFPQLFLSEVMELDDKMKSRIEKNIKAGILRINSFQSSGGGLSYWPGGSWYDDWATSYAGHFMIEAKEKGYAVSATFLKNWEKYQKRRAVNWDSEQSQYYYNSDLVQAYRLYTLALNKTPELAAMNLLREKKNLSTAARWRLAAAYELAGQIQSARELITNITTAIPDYKEMYYTYGSAERDQAMIIEALCLMKQYAKAAPVVRKLSQVMSRNTWMSTQTTAYCLIAITKFVQGQGTSSGLNFSYSINNGQLVTRNSSKTIMTMDMNLKGSAKKGKFKLVNNAKGILYARTLLQGVPAAGNEKAGNSNLNIEVNFYGPGGEKLNVTKIEQGTDFIAEISVSNPGLMGNYSNIALATIFPSGWEIHNTRMDEFYGKTKMAPYDYIDFRDDRVYTFFSLQANTKKTYQFLLNASYLGRFYLPAFLVEAMYDNAVFARNEGKWVEVVPYNDKATATK